jgi:hypothetical protein
MCARIVARVIPNLPALALLATQPDRPRPDLLRSAFALWVALALIGLILVLVVVALLAGRHRRLRAPGRRRVPPPQVQDAWAEAGRRAVAADPEPDPPPPGDKS